MTGRRILLVEGIDDEHVVKHICGTRGLGRLDEIKPLKGVDRLLANISIRAKASQEGDMLGVVIDADTNLDARWRGLRDRLSAIGYPQVPEAPDPFGTILPAPDPGTGGAILPRLGIWMMPDNQLPGILEDFLARLVPPDSLLFAHACASVDAIVPEERRFQPIHCSKALIHTWLAWQKEPGKPFGIAITEGFLDPAHPQADQFADWLRRLYRWPVAAQ